MNKTVVLVEIGGKTIEIERRGDRFVKPKELETFRGYGSAMKPSHEPILCFRKPRKGTYAQTAIEHGAGALWVDGARIPVADDEPNKRNATGSYNGDKSTTGWGNIYNHTRDATLTQGRWPANIILDEAAAQALDEMSGELTSGKPNGAKRNASGPFLAHANGVDLTGYGDTGGASRFFYCAKSSRSERERGLEGLPLQDSMKWSGGSEKMQGIAGSYPDGTPRPQQHARNTHPCVKPLALCEYLARLIVPPPAYREDARLLVPFCGSGSEILGALRAGWLHVDGIDDDAGYIEIARLRIAADMPLFAEAS